MERELRLERFLIGLRGLGLLRQWPFGDAARADAELRTIEQMLSRRDQPPMSETLLVTELDHADGYAAWAETYDEMDNALLDVEQPVLHDILEGFEPGDAADIACGTGRVTAILSELGHRVTAVDPSEQMLERARAKDLGATFVTGSFDPIPLADDSVDLVTCALALAHVTELATPMREIARILRPGGAAVLSDIHPIAVATGAQAFFRTADDGRAVTVNFVHQVSHYVAAFRAAGFSVQRCEEPLVDEGFKMGLRSEDVRAAADVGLTGLPLLLLWVLRLGE
jgi:ubiquinone/menaquinone biosynthesis C-methylase UbiE